MMPLVYQLMEQVLQALIFWCGKFFLAKDVEDWLRWSTAVKFVI